MDITTNQLFFPICIRKPNETTALNALRAFEGDGPSPVGEERRAELCVTPGAVSQLLKTLEQRLGVMLFKRANRGRHSDRGRTKLLPSVRNAFRQIADATNRIAAAGDTGLLTVAPRRSSPLPGSCHI